MKTAKSNKQELFSERTGSGKRSYFFDLKQGKGDDFYLTISESSSVNGGFERHRILVLNSDVDEFVNALNKIHRELQVLRKTREGN